jgi:hypothetical protein
MPASLAIANLCGVGRIVLFFSKSLGGDFLFVGLLISSIASELLCSKHWILGVFFLLPFFVV